MKQIKPCPFCGSDDLSVPEWSNKSYVQCGKCHAHGPDGKDREEAIERWNAAPRKEDVEMKKLELYECGLCHTRYNSKEECEKCERFHRKNLNIVEARYLSRAQDGTAIIWKPVRHGSRTSNTRWSYWGSGSNGNQ